jgi:hypothetical protein
MKTRFLNRAFALVLSVALLVCSVPAQDALGPNKLVAPPAPTLGGTTSLRRVFRGGRPMLGYVGRIGGVAFDGVAAPANDLSINRLELVYSPASTDGQRMFLSINGRSVAPSIYDWQLIPIAKFADSDNPSCVTLFGRLSNPDLEGLYVLLDGRFVNYHPSFANTLLGLRLFQLDDLIIDKWSYELPTEKGEYLLGAGESAPGEDKKVGWEKFWEYRDKNEALFESAISYLICDRDQLVTFDTRNGKLDLTGEPFYSFWDIDRAKYESLISGEALAAAKSALAVELRRAVPARTLAAQKSWLITQLQNGIDKYKTDVDDQMIVESLGYSALLNLLQLDSTARDESLKRQGVPALKNRLAELRTLQEMPVPRDVKELSQMLANNTEMIRAINPAVWDAGVVVMRYAAFFRYVKANYPEQWRSFRAQIGRAPAPQPPVKTPTVLMRRQQE